MPVEMIQKAEQFADTPTGWADRWRVEMDSAEENQKKWLERGDEVVKRFLDNRNSAAYGETRINLFTANVQTLQALLYGKTPQVDVKRRFADPGDDQARVAGEILQRLLNLDIERDSDSYATSLENALSDRLLPGLGVVRLRYEADFEEQDEVAAVMDDVGGVLAPAYTPEPKKSYECVETDYVYWKDFRWSPARTWDEVRWVAFKADMTYDAIVARFGEGHAKLVPMNAKLASKDEDAGDKHNPWSRAEVWEIWSKEHRKVQWWVKGYDQVLDEKADPLGLDGFWPCPRPMFANCTTTKLIPTPDFALAQDLYNEVDDISTRITNLERAINMRGVYDKTSEGVKRLLSEAVGNELIPLDDFAIFKDKGGLQAVVDWMPLDMVVGALDKLREYRGELMALLYQVTGMSDIMRGQSSGKATATEQAIKAKFASTRVQEFQNEFARFASDAQSIKAEIISKHYDPETILKQSNAQFMTGGDPQAAQAAIQLIKSDFYQYRIEVRPESVAMADMTAMKQERGEFLTAVATFLQSSQPVVMSAPWTAPFLLQMLQWSMAGFRGGSTIEGVFDQMVIAAQQQVKQQAAQPPPPDPKVEALKMKAQIDQQKAQMDMGIKRAGLQVDMQKAQIDLAVQKQKAQIELSKAGIEQKQAEISAAFDVRKMQQDMMMEARRNAMEDERAQQTHEQSLQQAKEKAAAAPKKGKE